MCTGTTAGNCAGSLPHPAPELFESTGTSAGPAGPLLSEAGRTPWPPLTTHHALCSEGLSSVSLWPPLDVGFPSTQWSTPAPFYHFAPACNHTLTLGVFLRLWISIPPNQVSVCTGEVAARPHSQLPPLTLHIKSGLKGRGGTVTLPSPEEGLQPPALGPHPLLGTAPGWHPGDCPGAQLPQAGLCVWASASQNPCDDDRQ